MKNKATLRERFLANRLVLAFVFLPIVFGCATGKDSTLATTCAGSSSMDAQAQAFAATLLPTFNKNGCANCHDGSGKAPYNFASSDAASGVSAAMRLADLSVPANSRFLSKVGLEMHQCGGSPTTCQSISNEMKAQIESWATQTAGIGTATCDEGTTLVSEKRKVVPTALADGLTKVYRWNMNGAKIHLGTVWLQMEVRQYQAPAGDAKGVFLIRAPVIASAEKRLRIGSIKVFINGRFDDTYSNFFGTSFIVDGKPFDPNAANWGLPVVSPATQLIGWESDNDEISFEIEAEATEEPADAPLQSYTCLDATRFTNTVLPILNTRCVSCHGTAGNAAVNGYSLLPSADRCSETLKKANLAAPTSSLLFRKARDNSSHVGGAPLAGRTADINAIIAWMQSEANLRQ